MQHYKIKIELKSDLCAASGSGHGCYIDSDVCFDKFGFPYIPAKRLKGCLADAANELIEWGCCDDENRCYTEEDKKRLFGEKGLNEGGSFSISNAYIENYREIYTMLDEMHSQSDSQSEDMHNQHDKEESKNKNKEQIKRSDIINYFTSTRTRTAINEATGTAKDGSLRTIRVINCIDPIKKEKFDNEKHNQNNDKYNKKDISRVFIAETSLSDPRDEELLIKCCKALRHMGSHRTRGFGAVKLSLVENNAIEKNEFIISKISDDCNKIKLLISLDSPIMISSNKASESMDYIPGTTILGYFAGQYLKYIKDDDDKNFYKFFVNGQEDGLYFSNFYISDKNHNRYFPAPVTCKKEKISEGICYNSVFYEKEQKQNPSKSLTNKFIRDIDIYPFGKLPECKSSKEYNCKNEYEIDKKRFVEVKKEVFYHHARPVDDKDGKKDKAIDTFYQYNAISADQYFVGEIKGSNEGLKTIVDLLNKNNCKMRIGKSKTAQYGSVTVVKYKEETSDEIKISVNKGNELAVVAQSHIMLLDDFGGNIIKPEEIVKKIAEKLFGKEDAQKYCVNEKTSFIKVDQIGGYNRKWNLERPPVPAIAPGSVFTFIYTGGKTEINKYISIGERQNEGLGKMYVWVKDAVSNDNQPIKKGVWINTTRDDNAKIQESENVLSILIDNIKRQENLLKLKKKALNNAERVNINSEKIDNQQKLLINSTTINNLLIKYMNGWKYSDFERHVKLIKDTTKRDEVIKLLFEDIEINSSNKYSSNISKNNASKNEVCSEKEKAVDNSSSNDKKNEIKIYIEQNLLEGVKQESNSNAKEELLEYYLKYYYINLLTQCRLNIRINGNEKGGDKNDK